MSEFFPRARAFGGGAVADVATKRRGVVRFDAIAARDDDGHFLALGSTLFAGAWLYQHDLPFLDRELRTLRAGGFDYARVIIDALAGVSWADRSMDSRAPGWAEWVAGYVDFAYDAYGIRTQITIFGGVPEDGKGRAEQIVREVCAIVNARPHKVFIIEIANEGVHNGWTVEEIRSLTRLARSLTLVPVAATATGDGHEPGSEHEQDLCHMYRDDVADVATMHFDRDFGGEPPGWRPVRKPWEYPWGDCSGMPQAHLNNEPIGPYSSVNSDDDPLRLVMAYATTLLVGGGGYVFHAGPGIRSGGAWDNRAAYDALGAQGPILMPDRNKGGGRDLPAHLDETPQWAEIIGGFRTVKALLPPDIPNWLRHNGHWPSNPIQIGGTAPFDRGDLVRLYTVEQHGQVWAVVIGIVRPVTAHSAGRLEAIDPLTGEVIAAGDGGLTLPARRRAAGDGYLLRCR